MKTGKLPDKKLLTTIITVLIFGWILSFSASIGHLNTYSYFIKQGFFILLGLSCGLLVLTMSISIFKKYSVEFFVIALIALVLVFLPPPIGHTVNGSTRWINLMFFNFQPSEMMKLAMILFVADFLTRQRDDFKKPWLGLVKILLIISFTSVLLLLETDFGAAIVIALTALSIVLVAGAYIKQLSIILAGLMTLFMVLIFFNQNRWERLISFWHRDLWASDNERLYQTKQALIGIARGDWTGTGLGAGIQKYNKLPEPHTDMIFAIIGEELGIVGMLFVLFCFAYIIKNGFDIAKKALKNGRKYSFYVAFGICAWMSMQVSVNISMNLGLIPPKGFTLPLISYGGSSLIFSIIALAFLLRIDMENRAGYAKQKQYV